MNRKAITLVLALVVVGYLYALAPPSLTAPEYRIVDPRYSVPIVALPGYKFNITIEGAGSVSSAQLVAPGVTYSLKIVKTYEEGDQVRCW